jgi:Lrp/AsnC family leucine-responsive transcriptional regulator
MSKRKGTKSKDALGIQLDDIYQKILQDLQLDCRVSYAELGRRYERSKGAIVERVGRMEKAGIIRGYSARVNPSALGIPFTVMICLSVDPVRIPELENIMRNRSEVSEWYVGEGSQSACFITAHLVSVAGLERLIDLFVPYGAPQVSLVLSSPVESRAIEGPRG